MKKSSNNYLVKTAVFLLTELFSELLPPDAKLARLWRRLLDAALFDFPASIGTAGKIIESVDIVDQQKILRSCASAFSNC